MSRTSRHGKACSPLSGIISMCDTLGSSSSVVITEVSLFQESDNGYYVLKLGSPNLK